MTKTLKITLIIFFVTLAGFSQTKYQQGYYIKTNNVKVDGLIFNEDWKSSPKSFRFKSNEDAKSEVISMSLITEFAVGSDFKFLKSKVEMDYSGDKVSTLSYVKAPEWKTKTVMLKVLQEGDYTLYYYEGDGLERFFYSDKDTNEIKQLIYKRYNYGVNKVKENNEYKQQLLNAFKTCENLALNTFNNLSYDSKSLEKVFQKYNSCSNNEFTSFTKQKRKIKFNLNARVGSYFSSIAITSGQNFSAARTPDFGSVSGIKYGIEGEVILPFKKPNWSAFLGYERKSDVEKTITYQTGAVSIPERDVTLRYKSSEILFGVRHYFTLSEDFRLSLGLGYLFDTRETVLVDFEVSEDIDDSGRGDGNMFGGLGVHYKNFALYGNTNFNKRFFKDSRAYDSDISEFTLTLSYSVFSSK